MPIDVHAHYVPPGIVEQLRKEGARLGISVVEAEPGCQSLRFAYGQEVRPFFAKLIEEPARRIAGMAGAGIDRQILSAWTDIFGYGLEPEQGAAWHRLLNESLAGLCHRHPGRFSMLASGPLPDAGRAARELEYAVRELGAVGAVAATNVEGTNLGELPLDEYWAAAEALGVPVFLEPEPDVAVVPGTARQYWHAHPSRPVLIVEVADSSVALDREHKASLYARAGVPDYWIVNVDEGPLEVHRQPVPSPDAAYGWGYAEIRRLGRDASVSPVAVPAASIPVADLLR